jgi:saccharopepsin
MYDCKLRVNPPGSIGPFNDTGISLQLLYGDGTYGVTGTIGVSPFAFGSYSVQRQAFLHATNSTIGLVNSLGLYGLFGLSFDFVTSSPINAAVKARYGNTATWGQSVLQNIFDQQPNQPKFISLYLSRTDDLEDTQGGSFFIGEYDPKFADVAKSPELPQYPDGGDRWTTLLEGIYVDGEAISITSSIEGVPAGHAQALLDTGVPTAVFPTAIWNAIYSLVPGAAKYYGNNFTLWVVPCNTTTIVELVFG